MKRTFALLLCILVIGFTCGCQNDQEHTSEGYLEGDTEFDREARVIMPELSSLENAISVEYETHRPNFEWEVGDKTYLKDHEWVVLKATFDEADFYAKIGWIMETVSFYEAEEIFGPYCESRNIFQLDAYTIHVVDIGSELPKANYCAVVGFNKMEHSIVYLFVRSEDFSYMAVEHVIENVWPYK